MAETKRGDALQLIFSFFLGILLVVFVGVGVWTFYPEPYRASSPEQEELNKLYRQLGTIEGKEKPTPSEQAEIDRLRARIDEINQTMQKKRDRWAVNTSIILLAFATLLMAISLLLPEHLKVFSNGILLGGVFTVLYGTGWSFAGQEARARFYVVLAALVLSLAFGYLRFIRGRATDLRAAQAAQSGSAPPLPGAPAAGQADAIAELSERVAELERRAAGAAAALGGGHDRAASED